LSETLIQQPKLRRQTMTRSTSKEPSPLVAALISVAVPIVMLGLVYLISNYRPPRGPLLEPAQAEFKPIATLIPGTSTRVTGTLQPWDDLPTTGRHIVLCQPIDDTPLPYDCRVTAYQAVTDSESHFQINDVQPGKYLILHDSGLVNFEEGYTKWQGQILRIGDHDWVFNNLFGGEPDGSFLICLGAVNGFYRFHPALTLAASGSPFSLAHDIDLASAYQGAEDTLPRGVFEPLLVEVKQGQASEVQFKASYCRPSYNDPRQRFSTRLESAN
jgi:hypothetical protein